MIAEVALPGLLFGVHRVACEEVPRFTPVSGPRDNQPQRRRLTWMPDRQGEDPDGTAVLRVSIVDLFFVPAELSSCDLPGGRFLPSTLSRRSRVSPQL